MTKVARLSTLLINSCVTGPIHPGVPVDKYIPPYFGSSIRPLPYTYTDHR